MNQRRRAYARAFSGAALATGGNGTVLTPQRLLAEGILRDPNIPEQALARGKSLLEHGRYREARVVFQPHVGSAQGSLRAQILEGLGQCALAGSGGAWQPVLEEALQCHIVANDVQGRARSRQLLAMGHMCSGDFRLADTYLRDAARDYDALNDHASRAYMACLRGRIRLKGGQLHKALQRIDGSLATLENRSAPRVEALVRLERARIVAHFGDAQAAAKELLRAERFLGWVRHPASLLRAKLVRAETLLILGENTRATKGLLGLLEDISQQENISVRASAQELTGRALSEQDATKARHYLSRARHLYEKLSFEYSLVACEIALARVDHALGLNARGRLAHLSNRHMTQWPLLTAELRVAMASVMENDEPERAKKYLETVIDFAKRTGNQTLYAQAMRQRAAESGGFELRTMERRRSAVPAISMGESSTYSRTPKDWARKSEPKKPESTQVVDIQGEAVSPLALRMPRVPTG